MGIENVIVVAGAGDNEAAAINTGTLADGSSNNSLGISGTIFIATDEYVSDRRNILHCHAHANCRWHLLGCVLSAASCNKWWIDQILRTEKNKTEKENLHLGRNRVLFLLYLFGDRILNDEYARACFIGMSADTTRESFACSI